MPRKESLEQRILEPEFELYLSKAIVSHNKTKLNMKKGITIGTIVASIAVIGTFGLFNKGDNSVDIYNPVHIEQAMQGEEDSALQGFEENEYNKSAATSYSDDKTPLSDNHTQSYKEKEEPVQITNTTNENTKPDTAYTTEQNINDKYSTMIENAYVMLKNVDYFDKRNLSQAFRAKEKLDDYLTGIKSKHPDIININSYSSLINYSKNKNQEWHNRAVSKDRALGREVQQIITSINNMNKNGGLSAEQITSYENRLNKIYRLYETDPLLLRYIAK